MGGMVRHNSFSGVDHLWPHKGDKVEVFSRGQNVWLPGVVLEVASKAGEMDGYTVEAGTLKVLYGGDRKRYIKRSEAISVLRKPPATASSSEMVVTPSGSPP